jgi:hypothetical protein
VKLLLPLKYYDEAGRVKPALGLYLCIVFLSRSLLVFIGSFSMQRYTNELLTLFYPEQKYLYIGLVGALCAVFGLVILGFREKIWKNNRSWLFLLLKPMLMVSILIDLTTHVILANIEHWMFSWVIAATLILDVFCMFFLLKDKHTKLMIMDWRTA